MVKAREAAVGESLRQKGLCVACAESCTGGLLSSRLTDVAGSSAYFAGGVVSYSNEIKAGVLGVSAGVLAEQGAVSEDAAKEMAAGVRRLMKTDLGISVTGVAGPGGTEDKPVGLVYIALADSCDIRAAKYIFSGNRREIKYQASETALEMLQNYLSR